MASTKTINSFFPIRWFSLINGNLLNQLFNLFVASVEDGITAKAGGVQATGYQLFATINRISVCATTGDSVLLPKNPYIGQVVQVINDGAQTAGIYGAGTDTIDGIATATGTTLQAADRSFFTCTGFSAGAYAWRSQFGTKTS